MRRLVLGVGLAALSLATGCGADSGTSTAASSPSSQAASPSSAATSAQPSSSSSFSSSSSGKATVLTGTVGAPDKPDAFVITLADSSGKPVTTLPAGNYQIQVKDLSKIHNFHLKGGSVDETTTVPEVKDTTFDVALTPGKYTFICDPHPRMVGSFSVT